MAELWKQFIQGHRIFYQPDLPPTINGLFLDIRAGENLGVVGTSGTETNLLYFTPLQPKKDQITVDEIPLNQICLHHLRQQIGVVLQENFLFSKSMSDNITQLPPDANLEEIIDVATLSDAHEFILKLLMGYDTMLAETGDINDVLDCPQCTT
ncbi:ATP-binding cassette domain-containing protein [Vibrio nigripulchritudo]|uniref:ATP-binding cassette domain-containing protein n=1 Tax=Vibrio nigripulchritudo TaxID=28173 RepID=UPI0024929D32|nr:ATP-binding cassette domain-containing protein [Vibrio nigripulchritudo]